MSNNCQVQTPDSYVLFLLDSVGYKNNLYGKKILENSCGHGNILIQIIERYILDSQKNNISIQDIVKGIENDIVAYETDETSIRICKERLETLRTKYNLPNIRWNIINDDFLKVAIQKYDFIIGNPPYITYHDLTLDERKFLHDNFESCKNGRFDYFYAFIEKSINSLNDRGKLSYLIPFSVFRNSSAKNLRNIIKPYIVDIYDYSGIKIFPSVITSSTIIVCENNTNNDNVNYYNTYSEESKTISKASFEDKWFFLDNKSANRRFGDFFYVQNSVATLLNKAFLIKEYTQDDKYTYTSSGKIENVLVKDAVSVKSIKKLHKTGNSEKIIFPYKITTTGYERYSKNEFEIRFPAASAYLKTYIEELKKRKSDINAHWFEYGRNQALGDIIGEKLILSMVITNKVTVYTASKETIPYAGYFVKKAKGSTLELETAKVILESEDFYKYVMSHGTPTTKTSYRISVKDILEYRF